MTDVERVLGLGESERLPGSLAPDVAGGSLTVGAWTVVSRVTGFVRLAVIAAVLGPTFLANTFQAVNQFPNLVYSALTGSVFTMLLVPPLVDHLDNEDAEGQERVACGFLGIVLLSFAVVGALAVVAGPLLLRLFAAGASEPHVAEAQRRVGWLLLVTVMPQVLLYSVVDTGEAVQYAHGRFALAAAAPAFENVGVSIVMVVVALRYGTGVDLGTVTNSEILLLGVGSTLAVLAHAAAQWWGSWRVGVRLIPRAGWRDAQVRELTGRALASVGFAALNSLRVFVILIVANRVPGGVVAIQLALNILYVPVALTAWPVSVALLRSLSRSYMAGAAQRFRDELVRGAGLVLFLAIPASCAIVALAGPIAHAVSFGQMATVRGIALVTASVAALGLNVFGEATWMLTTFAAYARKDARSPLVSIALRTVLSIAGLIVGFFFVRGTALLVAIGVAVTVGTLVGCWHLTTTLRRQLPAHGESLTPAVGRDVAASLLMLAPAWLVATLLPHVVGGRGGRVLAMTVAAAVGVAVFLSVQAAWRARELEELRDGFALLRRRSA